VEPRSTSGGSELETGTGSKAAREPDSTGREISSDHGWMSTASRRSQRLLPGAAKAGERAS
ncbi:MAG: hypothetical protein M3R24_33385, partial [Chloroflexota bacterium]|nr:hypothetical protein [Chloroflexota bacterium]